MQEIVILRGLPGSGKTTWANKINDSTSDVYVIVSADDYFVGEDGVYRFDKTKLAEAHGACQRNAAHALAEGASVIVDNTNIRLEHMRPYLGLAERFGCCVHIVRIESGMSSQELAEANVHGVPRYAIERMQRQWEELQ